MDLFRKKKNKDISQQNKPDQVQSQHNPKKQNPEITSNNQQTHKKRDDKNQNKKHKKQHIQENKHQSQHHQQQPDKNENTQYTKKSSNDSGQFKYDSNKDKNRVVNKVQEGMMSSKFRYLNEQLYTNESKEALKMFTENPKLFEDYHTGYRNQVDKWPKNPLDIIIDELKKEKYQNMNIGDFGCGEGRLQVDLKAAGHKGKIFSFDAGKMSPHIIQCDIANVPMKNCQLDVAIFSLSLMGTNFPYFLKEANRVLKHGGKLFVAEVMSRFTDINEFVNKMQTDVGFQSLKVNKLKDFFYVMVFEKVQDAHKLVINYDFAELLSPCKYKKR
eukprot:403364001